MKLKIQSNRFSADQLMPTWPFYIVIAIGAFLRLLALKSDPPLDLAKGQSLWTDPSQYVFFARNLIKFGRMDIFIPSGLIFFKYSFISFLSIPIFFILGSGFWQSNLVSSIISISTIIFFGLTIKNSLGIFAGVLASLFASVSYIFVMHNRVPYLENASLLFLVLASFFFILKYESRYGLILSGFFLSCSLLIGKALSILAFPAFIMALFLDGNRKGCPLKKRIIAIKELLLGFMVFTIIGMALFYLPNYFASREYLAENVINYYGFPDGLKSVSGFIKSLYTFDLINFENSFFDRIPIVSICALLLLPVLRIGRSANEEKKALFIYSLWFIIGCLFLSPWNYRPIRYEMYLVLPIIALASVFLRNLVNGELDWTLREMAFAIIPISLISFHIYFNYFRAGQNRNFDFWQTFGYCSIVSVIVSILIFYILRGIKRIKPRIRAIFVAFVVIISLNIDLRYFINWSSHLTYAIDYINRNIKEEISDKAVIMGPYAQTVTIGTNNKSEIFYFGAYPKNDSLFYRIPATHVIYEIGVDGSYSGNQEKFNEYYSKVKTGSEQIDSYLIGRYYVSLYNVTKGTDNISAKSYKMTDFERGMYYFNRNGYDSALVYFDRAENISDMKRASLYKGNIYYKQGKYDLAKIEYSRGLSDNCYDPKYWALYSISCKNSGDNKTADKAKEKALKYAPFPGFFQNINY